MVTPFRTLTLVHAVQQPLEPSLQRLQGALVVRHSGAVAGRGDLHADSTAKLDLLAEWQETRDDPSKDAWETVTLRSHVVEIPTHLESHPILLHLKRRRPCIWIDEILLFDTQQARAAGCDSAWRPPTSQLRSASIKSQINLAEKSPATSSATPAIATCATT